ncbi:MAG: SbcD_Mre11, partial [uncultured Rubrobacteraceae bacterium]
DHVRRRPDGVERVAGVDDEVDLTLQDLVDSSPVRLLCVDLPLVAVGLRAELRVPRVPQVRIRDV